MKHAWIYYLPLLFLPNLGFEQATPFGTLSVADFLIGPYLILVHLSGRGEQSDHGLNLDDLLPVLIAFFWWATISTLSIPLRYDYKDTYHLLFGLLKLGKLALYGVASIMTIRALARGGDEAQRRFQWALLLAGIFVGITLIVSQNSLDNLRSIRSSSARVEQVFQENSISVMLAILLTYLVGMILTNSNSINWKKAAIGGVIVMAIGLFFAAGRGGWVAIIMGIAYLFSQIQLKRTIFAAFIGVITIIYGYTNIPEFRREVDRTLRPDTQYLEAYDMGVFGIDDGQRLTILKRQAPKVLNNPILGTGFFHRGGQTGTYSAGSHNFFLQMFLETGIPGGFLILILLRQMWKQGAAQYEERHIPVKAALFAAIISGFSGEYFYGGIVFLSLMLVYAPIGCLYVQSAVDTPAR